MAVSMVVHLWLCVHGLVLCSHDKADEEALVSSGSESSLGRLGLSGFTLADMSMCLLSPSTMLPRKSHAPTPKRVHIWGVVDKGDNLAKLADYRKELETRKE
ncbi:hypothetical protein BS47DRAFT_1360932 [Hydnum rufescens UP504]|uniref:Uncharacterized protein n=1 Tax=Hydnum rufescens UP504 TaxID=1448309 RepID=A0A9P6DVM4_9AGAM|nr:hypothetical protein BS47DRAFT_1360932 [Hydnum rufescens UP504]